MSIRTPALLLSLALSAAAASAQTAAPAGPPAVAEPGWTGAAANTGKSDRAARRAQKQARLAAMTPDERSQREAKRNAMTPEQRAARRAARGGKTQAPAPAPS